MSQFKVEEFRQAAKKAAVSLRVFLAGPYIDVFGSPPAKTQFNGAARLRFELFKFLSRTIKAEVTLGEHKALKKIYKKHFEHLANAALNELAHVDSEVDIIVLIPSSPGSFSELGLFSMKDTICRKMLILLDKSKKNPPGFVHLGPVAFANNSGSEIQYINYADIKAATKVVHAFYESARVSKLANKYRLP